MIVEKFLFSCFLATDVSDRRESLSTILCPKKRNHYLGLFQTSVLDKTNRKVSKENENFWHQTELGSVGVLVNALKKSLRLLMNFSIGRASRY